MPWRRTPVNPLRSTSRRYVPGARPATVYTPAALDTVRRDAALSTLIATTVAPGTAAPVASVTTPVINPPPTCACAAPATASDAHNNAHTRTRRERIRRPLRALDFISNRNVFQIALNRLDS